MALTKSSSALISVISNVCLTALKLVVGLSTGMVSVVSEAAHSAVDLVASVIAFFSVRYSDRPPDPDHPFGHGKMENISGFVEGLLIFGAAGWIIYEAVRKIISGGEAESALPGIIVMSISALANVVVSQLLFRVAKRTDSMALEADAHHLSVDVYTSAGVLTGLVIIKITDWHIVDPLIAIAVACFILKIAWDVSGKAFRPLLDSSLSPEETQKICALLENHAPGLIGYHKLRTRKAGPRAIIDLHVQMPPQLSLELAHQESHALAAKIKEEFPNADVLIHIEPADGEKRSPEDA